MSPSKPKSPQAPVQASTTPPAAAQPAPTDVTAGLTLNEQVGHYIEMWKKSVEVQQHFNDIEWRIRGLALTVATFAFGAGGVAAKDGTQIGPISLGALVVVLGLVLWYGFYFVDQSWYHPLLKAAVAHGTVIEDEIKKSLPQAGMTATITARSPQETGKVVRILSGKKSMHSDDKLKWFYQTGAAAFVVAAIVLQGAAFLGPDVDPVQRIDVKLLPGASVATTVPRLPVAPGSTPGGQLSKSPVASPPAVTLPSAGATHSP